MLQSSAKIKLHTLGHSKPTRYILLTFIALTTLLCFTNIIILKNEWEESLENELQEIRYELDKFFSDTEMLLNFLGKFIAENKLDSKKNIGGIAKHLAKK